MGFLISKRDGANLMLALADGGAVEVFDAGAAGPAGLAHVFSPNTLQSFSGESFAPGTSGSIIAVATFVPQATGVILANMMLDIDTSAADQPAVALFLVENLTVITGGSSLVGTVVLPATMFGGIVLRPASTTPAFSGVPSAIDERATFVVPPAATPTCVLEVTATVLATVGVQAGIIAVATSPQNTNWTAIGNFSVHELL